MRHIRTSCPTHYVALACALALAPAWADDPQPPSASDAQIIVIEPGKIHEACTRLTPTQRLHYSFTASARLAFNINYHADGRTVYPVPERFASQADTVFTPDSDQRCCLMWTNRADTAIELRLDHSALNKP